MYVRCTPSVATKWLAFTRQQQAKELPGPQVLSPQRRSPCAQRNPHMPSTKYSPRLVSCGRAISACTPCLMVNADVVAFWNVAVVEHSQGWHCASSISTCVQHCSTCAQRSATPARCVSHSCLRAQPFKRLTIQSGGGSSLSSLAMRACRRTHSFCDACALSRCVGTYSRTLLRSWPCYTGGARATMFTTARGAVRSPPFGRCRGRQGNLVIESLKRPEVFLIIACMRNCHLQGLLCAWYKRAENVHPSAPLHHVEVRIAEKLTVFAARRLLPTRTHRMVCTRLLHTGAPKPHST